MTMKKALIIITTIFLLAGCNFNETNDTQTNESDAKTAVVTENTKTYTDEESNISFNYPLNWEVTEDTANQSVRIMSSSNPDNAGNRLTVTIPSESFEEYENTHQKIISENKMSINAYPEDFTLETEYDTKVYGQHGGLYQIIKINDNYIGVGSEFQFTDYEKQGLEEIINSLSF